MGEAIGLAREPNGYIFAPLPSLLLWAGSACLDRKAAWFQIKKDPQAARSPPGQALREPAPLFKKLDQSVIERESAQLEG